MLRPPFFVKAIVQQPNQHLLARSGFWHRRDNPRMTDWLSRLAGRVLRLVLIVAGLVFAFSVLVAGLILALVLGVVSLLRGRRPSAGWQAMRSARARAGAHMAGRAPRRHAGEVIDIEARELPPSR